MRAVVMDGLGHSYPDPADVDFEFGGLLSSFLMDNA